MKFDEAKSKEFFERLLLAINAKMKVDSLEITCGEGVRVKEARKEFEECFSAYHRALEELIPGRQK